MRLSDDNVDYLLDDLDKELDWLEDEWLAGRVTESEYRSARREILHEMYVVENYGPRAES